MIALRVAFQQNFAVQAKLQKEISGVPASNGSPIAFSKEARLAAAWEDPMWMRSCAVCKALLQKVRLCDSVRCQCGWIWSGLLR